MKNYIKFHNNLEKQRNLNKTPVVLIVGNVDSGKTTLSKILISYAARVERNPIFVDLDVGQNSISIEGTIGCCALDEPIDLEDELSLLSSVVYFFGSNTPSTNIEYYNRLVTK